MAESTIYAPIIEYSYTRTTDAYGQFTTAYPWSKILNIFCTNHSDIIFERASGAYGARAMLLVQESATGPNGYKFAANMSLNITEVVGGVISAILSLAHLLTGGRHEYFHNKTRTTVAFPKRFVSTQPANKKYFWNREFYVQPERCGTTLDSSKRIWIECIRSLFEFRRNHDGSGKALWRNIIIHHQQWENSFDIITELVRRNNTEQRANQLVRLGVA